MTSRIWATSSQASALAMVVAQSLASLRHRPSQASTTQRRGELISHIMPAEQVATKGREAFDDIVMARAFLYWHIYWHIAAQPHQPSWRVHRITQSFLDGVRVRCAGCGESITEDTRCVSGLPIHDNGKCLQRFLRSERADAAVGMKKARLRIPKGWTP